VAGVQLLWRWEGFAVRRDQVALLSGRMGLTFLSPALLFIILFLLFPFVWVVVISFTDRTLLGASAVSPEFVGLRNYLQLFNPERWMRRGEFGYSLYLTLIFVAGSVAGQMGLGIILSLLFYRREGVLKEVMYTLVTLAWILPEAAMAFTWSAFFDRDAGTLNAILGWFGLGPYDWLLDYPLLSIIIFNIWRGTAFSMLLMTAALGSIRPSYIETAMVAGASPWQRFRDIMFPLVRPQFLTGLVLITLWTFNVFSPFLLTQGGPAFQTEIVAIHTYRVAFRFYEFGRGSAIAVVVMVINLILASVYLLSQRRQGVRAR